MSARWTPLCRLNERTYWMTLHTPEVVKCAPLYIHTFPLLLPHHLTEAERFNIRYPNPKDITEAADKLRYYRYKKALLQREVADYLGIDRTTYVHYEEQARDYYPIEHMEKLAILYDVPVADLLDNYNLFLYGDQGRKIRTLRTSLGMTQAQYANYLSVPVGTLKKWEGNRVRISKTTWEKFFL